MRTLAIDTSLASGSVAALDGDRVATRRLDAPAEHARLLATAIADVTGQLGWRPGAAELVAVIRGPGSFTGLRVGVTTAKALAWAAGARLVGVSAFDAIACATARHVASSAGLAIGFDAGRGEVYAAWSRPVPTAAWGWQSDLPALVERDAWLAALPHGSVVSGPAVALLDDLLAGRPDLIVPPQDARAATAAEAGRIARLVAAAGGGDDPLTLVPEYLRPSYAEEGRAGTLGPPRRG